MNPFEKINEYTPATLETMNLDQLLAVQKSCLFPEEQEKFDRGESLPLDDDRNSFFDYTDRLICRFL